MFPILAWAVFFFYYNCCGYFVLSQCSVCMIVCSNILCLKLRKFPIFATKALTLYIWARCMAISEQQMAAVNNKGSWLEQAI
jgi:hypothetical protein